MQDADAAGDAIFFLARFSSRRSRPENAACRQWPGIGPERPVIPYSPKMFLRWWPRPVISSHGRPGHKAGTSGSLRTSGQRRAQGGETGRRRPDRPRRQDRDRVRAAASGSLFLLQSPATTTARPGPARVRPPASGSFDCYYMCY